MLPICWFDAFSCRIQTWNLISNMFHPWWNPVLVVLVRSHSADLGNGWTFVSVWYRVIQPLFCILMTRDVNVCVTVIFDPEGESCLSQRSAAFHWACCVFSDHTVKEPGPWDPKSLDIRGLWDATSLPPPLPTLEGSETNHDVPADWQMHQLWLFTASDIWK